MQPYFFPYIGYFQLINAVDKFVIYDDVNFIKGGWINRNNLLINKKRTLFTVPLDKASPFLLIKQTKINLKFYNSWKVKFLRSLEQSYKKAPFFYEVYPLVENVLDIQDEDLISKLALESIRMVSKYLQIQTEIIETSEIYNNRGFSGQERVINICRIEKASRYINPIGGIELYSKENFKEDDIELEFIKSNPISYKQFNNKEHFIPNLSIIDVLINCGKEKTQQLLNEYTLI